MDYIVLTPACDLSTSEHNTQPKAKQITLARIDSIDDVTESLSEAKKENKLKNIKSFKEHNLHFLPEAEGVFEGGCINFQYLFSEKIENILDKKNMR